jgi:pSer/pThr/pTyr-binding forkhead associated (FHA) protein
MSLGTLHIKMPDGQTRDFAVEQATVHAGRASDNELVLDEISVSRRHARLTFDAGQMAVEDLSSANGVFVSGRRLAPHVLTPVPIGETIQIGDVELRYELAAPAPPPLAMPPVSSAEAATVILPSPTVVESVPAERLGTLRIRTPNGADRDFVLEQPILTVGRATDNGLVIDEASISRRHARLTVEASRLMVEDLGSANGTFVGGQRLQPNTPSPVPAEQPVRLGDVELLFIPARPIVSAGSAPTVATGTIASGPPPVPLSVSIVGPAQPVAPGAIVTAAVVIHNRGATADEFAIRVSGVPGNWVTLSKDAVALAAGGKDQITLTFAPPRGIESAAADHRFTVSVISREHHTGVNAAGLLKVLPYQGFALSLQPVRGRRDFLILAENQGNAPGTYRLRGLDDELALLYSFGQETVGVAPGQTVSVPLQVIPKVQPRIGSSQVRPFSIVGTAVDQPGDAEARVDGQLVIRPPVPYWLIPVVLLLALCFCIGLAYGWVTLCPTLGPGMPFCQSGAKPVINVFTATPKEVDKGGSVVIAWDVSNAEQVEFTLPVANTVGPTGLQTFKVESSSAFTIKATNFAGSVEKSITVSVRKSPPVIQSFTANPGVVTAGQTQKIVLTWTVLDATTIHIEGVSNQNFPAAGSVEIPAPTANTTYTMVASNESGDVRQEITVVISAADCLVANVPGGEAFNLREGPGATYAAIVPLSNGIRLDPVGRNATGEWIKVRAAGREGWVPANFVSCSNVPDLSVYPTVAPDLIPTLAPTATPTLPPPTAAPLPTGTTPPTNTPPPTDTPTPTATPVLASGGLVTYRVQQGGKTSIFLQNAGGGPITLVADKDDAEVLDYTPQNGGRFAIWVSEGGAQKIYIVDQAGGQVGNPITGGWNSINDGNWSNDGQRLVVEATTGANIDYFYFDANGAPLGQPALP